MLNSRRLAPLFDVCVEIANEVADDTGFVPVRRLLERFHTELRFRPLLVEGMIGSTHLAGEHTPQWTVLIDSERYPNFERLIVQESIAEPLPSRFRFTVAHELAHSLAFRTGEFGVTLETASDERESKASFVRAIEEEADSLAPLLLCAERVITTQLQQLTGPLEISLLASLRRQSGMSQEVLLNRLALSRVMNRSGLWQRPHLREFGIAIGVWDSSGTVTLRRWPLFLNFNRLTPKGFLLARERDRVPISVAFGAESIAATHNASEITVTSTAGTPALPDAEQVILEISAEDTHRVGDSPFLILVRNRQIRREVEEFERIRATRTPRPRPST